MSILRMVRRFVLAWLRRRRDRCVLASLNEHELRDVGIDRSAVTNDDSVVFWRWR